MDLRSEMTSLFQQQLSGDLHIAVCVCVCACVHVCVCALLATVGLMVAGCGRRLYSELYSLGISSKKSHGIT